MLVLSEVATVIFRIRAHPHAFGLDADRDLGLHVAALGIHHRDHRVVLIGDVEHAALGIDGHELRVRTEVELARHFELAPCRSRP